MKSEREGKEERNEDLQIEDSKSLFEIEIDTSKIYNKVLKCRLSHHAVVNDSFSV